MKTHTTIRLTMSPAAPHPGIPVRRSRRRHLGTAVLLAAIAAVPTAASAATTTFGSNLNNPPANAGSACADNGVFGPALCTRVGSYYPGFSGRARAPRTGTVTAFTIRAQGPMTATLKIVSIRNLASDQRSGQVKTVRVGPTVRVNGPTPQQLEEGISPVETFRVNLKVKKGESVAIDTTNNTAEYCADGTPGQLLFSPRLRLGKGFRTSDGVGGCLLLVQAVMRY